ncbi:AAA family ATPase [Nakamurella sp. YIM 132087]|uniref:AAA family ATPase n=1 Tax=Nakamurella alba TaxID=2665158 RepID=A0A7K1FI16_9ACTN|nr:BTAD domain-containing putative transcriptional regulator [Nakamurella alba]MTD13738.1 AAA family ATPase [Nakamurella alba]
MTAAGAPARIRFLVLGPLQVLIDGRAVELGPARRRALLAALLVQPGRTVGLETLADRVWSGDPPASPAATLHAYVSRLRSALRSFDTDGTELPSPLRTAAPGYLMDIAPDDLDAHRFGTLVDRARERSTGGDTASARAAVSEALALWRGRPYADVPARFAELESDRLSSLHGAALELSVRLDLADGSTAGLDDRIRTLLPDHPLREGLHAALLLTLYRTGRQAEALAHYAVVRGMLADELGVDPGPELRRMHERILRQDPGLLRTDPPAVTGAPGPTPAGPVRTGPTPVPFGGPDAIRPAAAPPAAAPGAPAAAAPAAAAEFVALHAAASAAPATTLPPAVAGPRMLGRDRELAVAETAVQRARATGPAGIALVGEAGIGKTRLAEEVADRAARDGALVAWGRCWQHEGAPVLWPWIQALESLAARVDPAVLAAAASGRGGGIAALLPHLGTAPTGGRPIDLAQVQLYDAVAGFLTGLATDRPVLVVLEDMHWADRASLDMTEYLLANTPAGVRLAVLVTVRSPTEDSSRAGTELLTALTRSGRTDRVDLRGLSGETIRQYVAARTGSVVDDATAAALADRTGGNPFFLGELVRFVVTDDDPGADRTGRADVPERVPDSIREVVVRRLERLPEQDRAVLRCAAVVGRTFDLDLLAAACDLGEDAVDEAVDRATAAGIVVSDPEDATRHRFVHALTQQSLLETTGPARLRRLHGRVAQALERRGQPVTAAGAEQLGYHLASSGGEDALRRAIALHLDVAHRLTGHGNLPGAESLLLRALELTARIDGEPGQRAEMTVRVRLCALYIDASGPASPAATGQRLRARALIDRFGGPLDVLAGHQAAWATAVMADDLRTAASLAEEMTAAAEASDDDLMRFAARLCRGQLLMHRGEPVGAMAEFDLARGYGPVLDDVPAGVFPLQPRLWVAVWRATAAAVLDDTGALTDELAGLRDLLPTASEPTAAYVDTMLANLHALRDDPVATLSHARRARDRMVEFGAGEAVAFVDVLLGWARGRCEPGVGPHAVLQAVTASLTLPTMAFRPMMRGLAADLLIRSDRCAEALRMLDLAEQDSIDTGDRLAAAETSRLRALALGALGDSDGAATALEAGRRIATDQGAALFLRRTLVIPVVAGSGSQAAGQRLPPAAAGADAS